MVVSFNESDWTSGWNHLLVGATLYLLPSYENTLGNTNLISFNLSLLNYLDPDDSIALNPNEIPMVTFRQRITKVGFQIQNPHWLKALATNQQIETGSRNLDRLITFAENRDLHCSVTSIHIQRSNVCTRIVHV